MNLEKLERKLLRCRLVTNEGCWEYLGCKNRGGYGWMTVEGKQYIVSRLAAFVWMGIKPEDLNNEDSFILHKCDNPACFNPDHLYKGTKGENAADSIRRGSWDKQRAILRGDTFRCGHPRDFTNMYSYGGKQKCKTCEKARYERNKIH